MTKHSTAQQRIKCKKKLILQVRTYRRNFFHNLGAGQTFKKKLTQNSETIKETLINSNIRSQNFYIKGSYKQTTHWEKDFQHMTKI